MTSIERALLSLRGLWVGDCFGECFMIPPGFAVAKIEARQLPAPPWAYTDDTEMAISIVEQLRDGGAIDQDALALAFAQRFSLERGYGKGAYKVLAGVQEGLNWRELSYSGFRGMGSFGNGAAMRVAPLGAYFAEEAIEYLIEEARRSAEVTHAHPEGIAGAIAVAVATSLAWKYRSQRTPLGYDWIREVLVWVPEGYTKEAIAEALDVPFRVTSREAAAVLGNGSGVTSPDTVPLCLWVAAQYSRDYEAAMWEMVSALGDRDTNCAIVGGIIAMTCGLEGIPQAWRDAAEPFTLA